MDGQANEVTIDAPERVARSISLPEPADRTRFFLVAAGAALMMIAVVLVVSLARNDGHLVFALDDAGIHMSIARQLVEHGTWGVTDGVYVSASSSPLWTFALSGLMLISPVPDSVWPLALNVGAGLWIIWLFAANQTVIRPRGRAVGSWIAAILLPLFVLGIPAMTAIGMEHLLHAALVVEILVIVWKLEDRRIDLRTIALLVVIVFLAGAVRVETVFLAAGIVVGLGVRRIPRFATDASTANWTTGGIALVAVLIGAAAALPLMIYGVVNRAFGAAFLPNSIAAKQAMGDRGLFRPLDDVFFELFSDAVLTALVVGVIAYVVFAGFGGPRRALVIAVAFLVATFIHGVYGEMRFYDRYQNYLLVGGAFVVLVILGEVVSLQWRGATATFLVFAMAATAAPMKIPLVVDAPLAMSNTYRQRYQVGHFFGEHYRGQTVATGELGYVTYFHDGGIVDFLGLGSPQVTEALREEYPLPAEYVERLVLGEDVAAIAVYPKTLALSLPDSWQLAGEWTLDERTVTAFDETIDFYAPTKELGRELAARLDAFAPSLPSNVTYLDRETLIERFLANG